MFSLDRVAVKSDVNGILVVGVDLDSSNVLSGGHVRVGDIDKGRGSDGSGEYFSVVRSYDPHIVVLGRDRDGRNRNVSCGRRCWRPENLTHHGHVITLIDRAIKLVGSKINRLTR